MKRKILAIASILFLFFIVSDCASLYHDQSMNPCTPNSSLSNAKECEAWKKNYPKEYKAYQKRMEKERQKKGN